VAGAKLAGLMISRVTVTQKPVSPGRARHSTLKPSRRECRCFGWTCGEYACVLSQSAHKAAGAAKHPAFPAPSRLWRAIEMQLGRDRAAGTRIYVLRLASTARQSRSFGGETLDCFVAYAPRNDGEGLFEMWISYGGRASTAQPSCDRAHCIRPPTGPS